MAGGKGMPGGPGMAGRFRGMGDRRDGGEPTVQNPTPNNNIERNRYLQPAKKEGETDKPSRHLPLAVQLIIEQSHMPDVLVAMANSRLRIQITQVEAHRIQDYKPQADDKKGGGPEMRTFMAPDMAIYRRAMQASRAAAGSMSPPGSNRRGPGGMRGGMAPGGMYNMPRMMPGMGGPRGGRGAMPKTIGLPGTQWRGPMPTTGEDKTNKSQNEGDGNLVEMTVYGIATLYRLPDPTTSESADQSGQPGQPTQPAATTPPVGGKR
jgi:hypothetical protein